MPSPRDTIRTAIDGETSDWLQIQSALDQIAGSEHSPEAEQLMADVLTAHAPVRLHEASEAPHAMSPIDSMRARAMQILAQWERHEHVARFHDATESASLQRLARALIPDDLDPSDGG